MGDSDAPPEWEYRPEVPLVLRPGQRYRILQPCEDPLVVMTMATAMTGSTVPFSMEGKLVGHARIVGAGPAPDGSGVMFTCELMTMMVN